jgi:hypothetical protein
MMNPLYLAIGIGTLCAGIFEMIDVHYSVELIWVHHKMPTLRHLLPLSIFVDCMYQRNKMKKFNQEV